MPSSFSRKLLAQLNKRGSQWTMGGVAYLGRWTRRGNYATRFLSLICVSRNSVQTFSVCFQSFQNFSSTDLRPVVEAVNKRMRHSNNAASYDGSKVAVIYCFDCLLINMSRSLLVVFTRCSLTQHHPSYSRVSVIFLKFLTLSTLQAQLIKSYGRFAECLHGCWTRAEWCKWHRCWQRVSKETKKQFQRHQRRIVFFAIETSS